MKRISILILIIIGITVLGIMIIPKILLPEETENVVELPEKTTKVETNIKTITFDDLGISLEVPKAMYVKKNPNVSLNDPSVLESYIFYIQNYENSINETTEYFQMYGLYQYSTPGISWERFSEIKDGSEIYEYVKEIEFDGIKGYEAKLSGERNNYVYLLHIDNKVLRIAVSKATEKNKSIADKILSSLKVEAEKPNSASNMQKVIDPEGYYSILIPNDWVYSFDRPIGSIPYGLAAESSDSEVFVDTSVDGPHDNIYYKKGINLNVSIVEKGEDLSSPYIAQSIDEEIVYLDGVEATLYTFKEPSTAQGQLMDLRLVNNNIGYSFRFGYADDVDLETIKQIIDNIIILK